MKVDNVTFVEVAVKGMTKEEFINAHIKVVWQELKEADRKKKLSEVYDAITKEPTGWGVITARPVIFLLYGRF